MSLKKKVAHNTIIQIVGKSVSTFLGIIALAIITRYLGASKFGEYSTIITFVSFFAMSADLGLTLISAQMISNPKEDQNKILSNLFSVRLISALVLLSLAPIFIIFFPYSNSIKIGVAIATLAYIFPALNQILIALFQKTLKMSRAMIAEVAGKLFLVIGVIVVFYLDLKLIGILWASVFSAAIGFLAHWFLSKKSAKIKIEFDFNVWKKIARKTWPLALTIFLNLVYQKGDILLLSLFQDIKDVGIYGASYRTIEVIGTIPYMFAGIMLPLFTFNWINKNFDFLKKMIQKSFDLMIILAIPLLVGSQFVSTEIISLIAGEEFIKSGLPLQILIISIALLFISCIFSHVIIAIDKQKKAINLYIFTAITSLILYLILIPKFSYIGASIVTIYSNVVILIGVVYYVKRFTGFRPEIKIVYKSILASLIMAIFMLVLPRHLYQQNMILLAIISIAMLIYFIALYFLKGFNKDDLKILLPNKK
jgi:O-antigen/teichoic acid export membrane protein